MPLYEVYHSYPLTIEQRQTLAKSITDLHCTTFTTPSFFVHVRFIAHDPRDQTYFTAGKPRTVNSNRIICTVRTSPARLKSDFETLAGKIEDAWYNAVNGHTLAGDEFGGETAIRRLLMVTFIPMVAIREGGMTLPEAGKENDWLQDQLSFIKQMSERSGMEDFAEMLQELKEKKYLKSLLKEGEEPNKF
ncbi:hypothetical protein QQS21_007066 [Conoideocrella luteorostrata]|uniref:Tautomerase cis-CaaD-like domain-containing protein n=1 Tax=Conoideocrella luteorostrata TaxID=1105319 RepID=A0AAJ0FXR1_9HYPO|nr:hypothetical protein QQS21_007066 [Conoideocrella luteorostrata]